MSDESSQDRRVKELWQSQPTEGVRMSIDQIRVSAGTFQRRIQWRNVREYVTAIALIAFFSFELWRAGDMLVRIGFGLIIAGIFYLIWHCCPRVPGGRSLKTQGFRVALSSSAASLNSSVTYSPASGAGIWAL